MKSRYLSCFIVFLIFSFFVGFKPSGVFAQSCSQDHHLCYADVGCIVGQPCNAPVCQPDGAGYGHISSPQHCDWCPGAGDNCVWYDYHPCIAGCTCEGCPHGNGNGNGNKHYNGVVLAEDTGGTRYVPPAVQVTVSSGSREWKPDGSPDHFDIKSASSGNNTITLSQLASGYVGCSWVVRERRCSDLQDIGIIASGTGCAATFDFPGDCDWQVGVTLTMLLPAAEEECSGSVDVEVIPSGPWYQTQEGDVRAEASIGADIPQSCVDDPSCEAVFSLDGSGGSPGVVSYGGGIAPDFSPGSVSSTGWLAGHSFSKKGYDFFYQLLGSPTSANFSDLSDIDVGEVVYYGGDATDVSIDADFPGGRKAVVFVDGNVIINTDINVSEGDFLAIIASGEIEINPSVSQIEGVFISDDAFKTGVTAALGTEFTGEGMFIADSFTLGRNLDTGNQWPAEKFIYRPDFWLNAPNEILVSSYTWEEVVP